MKKVLLLLFAFLSSVWATAQITDFYTLVVHAIDGKEYRFDLFSSPGGKFFDKMEFSDGVLSTSYRVYGELEEEPIGDYDFMDGLPLIEEGVLSLPRDEVDRITIESFSQSSVELLEGQKQAVTFNLLGAGKVGIHGLNVGDHIEVATTDGRSILSTKAQASGSTMIDLTQQSSKIFVISINRSFTFKIMKP